MKKVIGFAGWSGCGKTTLIEQVIPLLRLEGWRVSLIKHAHHRFEIDYPGKDSYRHREAGCTEVLITSRHRWALIHESRDEEELVLEQLLDKLSSCDIVIVEGFKFDPIPKIEVYRPSVGKPPLFGKDPHVVALATDEPIECPLPVLDLNNPEAVASFVMGVLGLARVDTGGAGS
jgi:molybdopterin-guanine dinucleotide biosynthesis protein B